jgi:hypothetical protein
MRKEMQKANPQISILDPNFIDILCPYCGSKAQLMDSAAVYGRSYGMIWACPGDCDAFVGCHKDAPNHPPLGTLANKELRAWRIRAHANLDPLWKSGRMTRKAVYQILQDAMQLSKGQAHIAMFDIEECKEVIRICKELTKA